MEARMPQKISLSSWNIGEVSQTSIGDYQQPLYQTSCRFLRNFVVSETGKLWRRPGYEYHVDIDQEDVRLIPYYHRDTTSILVFYLTGTHPDLTLSFDWYYLEDNGEGRMKFVKQNTTVYELLNSYGTTFRQEDFESDRPQSVDLKKLSWVQVDNFIYLTHPNMEDPFEIKFEGTGFSNQNFSTSDRSYYFDIQYDETDTSNPKWIKKIQTNLAEGGGVATDNNDLGWQNYTGKQAKSDQPNQGKSNDVPIQSFKYLAAVTFYMERLVWVTGPRVHASSGGDPLGCGLQYNTGIPATITLDPFTILASDPIMYRASSDLGYDIFQWVASGPLLMGGANSGAWVLSDPQTRAIDATHPLMYKATSNGAYWVPGKTVGDAMLYFQRPGIQMNEFLFSNVSQNFVARDLTEFSSHLFFDYRPIEMNVQRSPFNAAMILRDNGTLVSLTYHRQKEIAAWAQQPFDDVSNANVTDNGSHVISGTIFSDGIYDQMVIAVRRYNSEGSYMALEMMDRYTPSVVGGIFVDTAITQTLSNELNITDITPDTDAHIFTYDNTNGELAENDFIEFIGARRTDDGIQPVTSNNYDYIYGQWQVFDVDTVNHTFKVKDKTGKYYIGIYELFSSTVQENAYYDRGTIRKVSSHPTDGRFEPLRGIICKALFDGKPFDIYVSKDYSKFYTAESIPPEWDGDETILEENEVYWNDIILGRPYTSLFSPVVLKKQIHKGKLNKIELEVFNSLGGKVGIGKVSLDNVISIIKEADLFYPVTFEEDELYTGTLKPDIVSGYEGDPLWYLRTNDAMPFNITNITYELGSN